MSFLLLAFVGTVWTLANFPFAHVRAEYRVWNKRRNYLKRIGGSK